MAALGDLYRNCATKYCETAIQKKRLLNSARSLALQRGRKEAPTSHFRLLLGNLEICTDASLRAICESNDFKSALSDVFLRSGGPVALQPLA